MRGVPDGPPNSDHVDYVRPPGGVGVLSVAQRDCISTRSRVMYFFYMTYAHRRAYVTLRTIFYVIMNNLCAVSYNVVHSSVENFSQHAYAHMLVCTYMCMVMQKKST